MKRYALPRLFVGALLAAGPTWAETVAPETSPEQRVPPTVAPVERQESSQDETWTWFGMGFEDRHRLLDDGADGFGPDRRPAGGFSGNPVRNSGRK